MKEAIPSKPVGESPKWFFMRRVWDYCFGGKFPIRGVRGIVVEYKENAYEISTANQRRSTAGDSEAQNWFRGDWDSEATYSAQQVVRLSGVGMFVALQDVPVGTSPDTGDPYWFFWLNPPPGVWSL